MESSAEDYAAFEEKVKRTVYVDNLSHLVTAPVLRSAFDQFGIVKDIYFIPNYFQPNKGPLAALVEMGNPNQAEQIILGMANSPFMVSGMPRPVRARPSEPNMFEDRPRKPNTPINFRWVDPNDSDFEVAKKIKLLVIKHAAEASFICKTQLDEEEKLANKHSQTLMSRYKTYEMIENAVNDGLVDRCCYEMNISVGRGGRW